MGAPELRNARPDDVPAIHALIVSAMLPAMEIEEWLDGFFVLEQDGRLVGCIGVELYGEASFVRSAVVDPALRRTGEGRRIAEHSLEYARANGAKRCYLFTLDAAGFFARLGFERCSINDFEPAVRDSWQVRGVSENPQLREMLIAMRMDLSPVGQGPRPD